MILTDEDNHSSQKVISLIYMRRYLLYPCLSVLCAMLILTSCDEESISPGMTDTSYFPLEVGNYIIYEIDSTVYDDFTMTVNQTIMQVREVVESEIVDNAGNPAFRIERSYRMDSTEVWGTRGYDIWSANLNGNKAERVEENQRYIKLVFPVADGKSWAGNIYINVDPLSELAYLEGWTYVMNKVHTPGVWNGNAFDSTLTVIQHEEGTLIDTIGSREVYAKGVGLVYKEFWVLESQCTSCSPTDIPCLAACQALPWEQKAEKGFIVKQTLLSYGKL